MIKKFFALIAAFGLLQSARTQTCYPNSYLKSQCLNNLDVTYNTTDWLGSGFTSYTEDTLSTKWDTIIVAPGHKYEFIIPPPTAANGGNAIMAITACSNVNIQLGYQDASGDYWTQDLNNYTGCNGYSTNGEYAETTVQTTGSSYIYIASGTSGGLADSAEICYRMLWCPHTFTGYSADSLWIGYVYGGAMGWNNGNQGNFMGNYGTEEPVFTHDFGSGQPGGYSAYLCPDSNCVHNDSFQIVYRKNIDLPQTYLRTTSSYVADGGMYLATNTGTIFSNSSDYTWLYYPSYGNQWTLAFQKLTDTLVTSIDICQMAGNFTYGTDTFRSYVYNTSTISNPEPDQNYEGTFNTDSLKFAYNWPSDSQPVMVGNRCGKTMSNTTYGISFLGLNTNALGSYEFRVRGQAYTTFSYLQKGAGSWTTVFNDVSLGDYTSSLINFTQDSTYFRILFYKTAGLAAISFNYAIQPKNPGNMHATHDTVCFGSPVTLSIDTNSGTQTQWYQNSCAGSGIYLGTGATFTVTPDSSTTYYARNDYHGIVPGDTSNVLDLYSTNCASIRVIVNPNPSAPTAPTAQTACSSAANTFTFSSVAAGSGGNQIQWATNSGFADSTIASSPANVTATVSDGVKDTVWIRSRASATGCVSSAVTTTATNYANPSATASNSGPYCSYGTISLTGGANGLSSYSWSGPNSFTSRSQDTTLPASGNGGTYTITVTNSNSCTASASTSVTVNTAPTATASNSGPYCSYNTISLTGGLNSMSVYRWGGPNSFISASQDTTLSANGNGGTYNITVTDGNGCTATATTSVTVNTPPTATANNSGPYCSYGTISLTGGPNSMSSYSWAGPNSFVSASEDTIFPASGNGGTYTLTVTDNNGCSGTANTNVTVNTAPGTPSTPLSQSVCSDTAYTFTFSSVTAGSGGNQIEWATNSSFSGSTVASSPTNISVTVTSGGTTTIYIRSRVSATGCVSSAVTTLATNNVIPTAPTAPNSVGVCSDTPYNFIFRSITAGTGGNMVEWSLNNNFNDSTVISNGDSISLTINVGAIDVIWMKSLSNLTGCVGKPVYTVARVNPFPGDVFNPRYDTILEGDSALLECPVGFQCYWYDINDTAFNRIILPSQDTTLIEVKCTDIVGCSSVDTTEVIVSHVPTITVINYKDTLKAAGDSTNIIITSNLANTIISWTRNNDTIVYGQDSGIGNIINIPLLNDTTFPSAVNFTVIGMHEGKSSNTALTSVLLGANGNPNLTISVMSLSNGPSLVTCSKDTLFLNLHFIDSVGPTYFGILFNLGIQGGGTISDTTFNSLLPAGFRDTLIDGNIFIYTTHSFNIAADSNLQLPFSLLIPCSTLPNHLGQQPWGLVINNLAMDTVIGLDSFPVPGGPSSLYYYASSDSLIQFLTPNIVTLSSPPQDIYLTLNGDSSFEVTYINDGTAPYTGELVFSAPFSDCGSVQVDSIVVTIRDSNDVIHDSTFYSGLTPFTFDLGEHGWSLPVNYTISFREYVTLISCLPGACTTGVTVQWGCPDNLCRSTEDDITAIQTSEPSLFIYRIAPNNFLDVPPGYQVNANDAAWDSSCVGEGYTQWDFLIVNTGASATDSVNILLNMRNEGSLFTYIFDPTYRRYTFPNPASFDHTFSGPDTTLLIDETIETLDSSTPTHCNTDIQTQFGAAAITDYELTLPQLQPAQNFILSFRTYRCCPDSADINFNTGVNFNHWKIRATYNYCGQANYIEGYETGGQFTINGNLDTLHRAFWGSSSIDSGYISSNVDDGTPDLSLAQQLESYYYPNDLYGGIKGKCGLLPNGYCSTSSDSNCCGDPSEVRIKNGPFISLNDSDDYDSQLFSESGGAGPSGSSTTGINPNGRFQVVIRPHGIKLVDDYNDTVPLIISNGTINWESSSKTFFCKNASVYDDTIVAIFDMDSLPPSIRATSGAFKNYFNNSYIQLYVQSCCPLEDSGGVDITTGYLTVETSFNPLPQLNCARCMIPLSRVVTPGIQLHCPGCVTPGITSNFNLLRTNLGYHDNDQNWGAPSGGVLNRIYPTDSIYSQINKIGFIVGDSMQVTSSGQFLDGETDSVKFSYIQSYGVKITDFYVEEHFTQLYANGVHLQFNGGTLTVTHFSYNYPSPGSTLQANTFNYPILTPSDIDNVGGFLFHANLDSLISNLFPLDSVAGIQPNDTFGFIGNYTVCTNPAVTDSNNVIVNPEVQFSISNYMYLTVAPLNVPWGFINSTDSGAVGTTVGAAYAADSDRYVPTGTGLYDLFYCDSRTGSGVIYPIISEYGESWSAIGCFDVDGNDWLQVSGGYYIKGDLSLPDPFPYEFRLLPGIGVDMNNPTNLLFYRNDASEPVFNITDPRGFGMVFDSLWTTYPIGSSSAGSPAYHENAITTGTKILTTPTLASWPRVQANNGKVHFTCGANTDSVRYTYPSTSIGANNIVVGDGWFQQGINFELYPLCSINPHDSCVNIGDEDFIIPDYRSGCPADSFPPYPDDTLVGNPGCAWCQSHSVTCLAFPNEGYVDTASIAFDTLHVTGQDIYDTVTMYVINDLGAFYFYYGRNWPQYADNGDSIVSVVQEPGGVDSFFHPVLNTQPDSFYAALFSEVKHGDNSFIFHIHLGNCDGLTSGSIVTLPIYYKWNCNGAFDWNNTSDSFPEISYCSDTQSFRLILDYSNNVGAACTLNLGGIPQPTGASTCAGLPMQFAIQSKFPGAIGNLSFDMALPNGFSIANTDTNGISLSYHDSTYHVPTTPPIISSQSNGAGGNLWRFDLTGFTAFDTGFSRLHIPPTGLTDTCPNLYINFIVNVPCQKSGIPIFPALLDTLSGKLYCGSTFTNVTSNNGNPYSLPDSFVWTNGCGPYINMESVSGECQQKAYYQVWGNPGVTQAPLSIVWTSGIDSFTQNSIDTTADTTTLPYSTGIYYVLVTDSNGCIATDSAVSSSMGPPPSANAGPNDSICAGNNDTLSYATAANYDSLRWSSSSGGAFSNDTVLNPVFYTSGIPSGNVTLQLIAIGSPSCGNDTSMMVLTLKPTVTPTVSITASHSSPICYDTSVTFTATATNGGSGVTYQWQKNGGNISGATSSTYTSASLRNGDFISCMITSDATCASPTTAISDTIAYEVDSIALTPSGTDSVCAATNNGVISVSATGGSSPYHYVWTNGDTTPSIDNLPPGAYSVTVTDALGCRDVKADTITSINNCCTAGSAYTFGSIKASDLVTLLGLPYVSELGYKLNLGDTDISFNGTFTVDVNFAIIKSQNVTFGPGAEIYIDSAATLTATLSNLYPCDSFLWKGIVVPGGATFYSTGNSIAGAQYAVEAFNNANISIEGTTFENDFIGFYFNPYSPIAPTRLSTNLGMVNFRGPFIANKFIGGQLLHPYPGMTNTGYQPADSLVTWSWAGMELDFLRRMEVGVPIQHPDTTMNIFETMANGIIARNCVLYVVNSDFADIFNYGYNVSNIYGQFQGNGIFAFGSLSLRSCLAGAPCPDQPVYGSLYQRGFGKYAPFGRTTFSNCTRAISATAVNIDVADNRIINLLDSSLVGIRVAFGVGAATNVNNNWISTQTRGIQLIDNDPTPGEYINNNIIDISSSVDTGIGMEMYEIGNAPYFTGAATIAGNTINVDTGALKGMMITGTNGLIVNTDTVNMNYVQGNLAGIEYQGCKNLYDYQNIVSGNASYVVANDSFPHCPVGIYYYNTSGLASGTDTMYTVHKCNTVKNLHIGMQFTGADLYTTLTSNNFNDPSGTGTLDTALLVDTMATIPAQTNQANKWWGSSSQYQTAAKNRNGSPAFYITEEFAVEPHSPYLPPSIDPGPWFTSGIDDTDKCSESIVAHADTGISPIEYQVIYAINIIGGIVPLPELNWQNGIIVLGRILHNRSLEDSDAIIQQFFNTEDTAAMGHLVVINDSLQHIIQPGTGTLMQMQLLQDTITALKKATTSVDSAIGVLIDPTLANINTTEIAEILTDGDSSEYYLYDSLMNVIAGLHGFIHDTVTLKYLDSIKLTLNIALLTKIQGMDSLVQSINTIRFQQMQLLSDSNNLIQPSIDIDSQYKQINNIYFNSLQVDSVSFSSSQLASLTALAFECPLIGGDAVFKARAMLALLEDNVYFDDVLCSGIELRMARVKQDTVPTPLAIKLYPNPANDYAILQFTGNTNDAMQLKISDGLGNIVFNNQITAFNGIYFINTSGFGEGMYYVAVYDKTGRIFGEKLCIFMK